MSQTVGPPFSAGQADRPVGTKSCVLTREFFPPAKKSKTTKSLLTAMIQRAAPYLVPAFSKPPTPTTTPTSMPLALPLLSSTAMIHHPERDEMLCRYPSKLCDNRRSEKRGGGLHRFCAYHRERANVNQRRVDHRRRLRRQGVPVPPIERSRDWLYPHSDSDVKSEEGDERQELTFDVSDVALPEFSESELQELLQLLEDVDTDAELQIKDEPTLQIKNEPTLA